MEKSNNIKKFENFNLNESKYDAVDHINTIKTYLDEISEGIEKINDTKQLEDIEHTLSSILYKYILDDE